MCTWPSLPKQDPRGRECQASPAMEEERRAGRQEGLTCGQARGAAAAPAQSPCSADTARTAAGRPSSAPSTKAPPGHPAEAHLRSRSWRGILGFPRLTQGDGAAVGVEVERDSTLRQPPSQGLRNGGPPEKSRVWSLTCPSGGPEVSGGPCSQAAGSKSRAVAQ